MHRVSGPSCRDPLRAWPALAFLAYHLLLFVFILLGVFSTPLPLAYIFHRLELRGTLKNLDTKQSPTPSDLLFSNSEGKHYYVRFHRKDGKDLGGYFGENSFAEASPDGQEIYVEEVWRLDEDGRFIERIERTKGAIVNREDCELIEFFETPEARDESTLDGGRTEPDTTANTRKRLGR